MKAWTLIASLWGGMGIAETPPALLTSRLDRVEKRTAQARERLDTLSRVNLQALERLAAEGTRRPDPALRLWAERERRLHETTPFCNLARPERVTGYPEDLQTLSASLRGELTDLLGRMRKERDTLVEEAEAAFDARVRSLVRADELEAAKRERDAFREFGAQPAVKALDREIRRVERLLSGKAHRNLWRRPKDDGIPAPPDALFLFESANPSFRSFVESVSATSNGSPDRGASIATVGKRIRVEGKRGLTLLALAGNEEVLREHYDTYESKKEGLRLVEDVKALPYGAFVILFAHDDATRRFPGEAQSTLFRLGAEKGLDELPYRGAYLLIGLKGMRPGGALETRDPAQASHP